MERLLVPERLGERTICVLGAGNCNDLDLAWLTKAYREVHLVDIDNDALERAAKRQRVDGKVTLHAPVDLTSAADVVGRWGGIKPDGAQVESYLTTMRDAPFPALGPFGVVLSPCVLSQLLFPIRKLMGSDHARYPEVRSAIRSRHLRLMHSLLEPGGEGILAIDLVSSETFPDLARVAESQLPDLMQRLISNGKFFKGLQPEAFKATLGSDAELRLGLPTLRFIPPWRWHLALNKSFLVYGVRWRRATTGYAPGDMATIPCGL